MLKIIKHDLLGETQVVSEPKQRHLRQSEKGRVSQYAEDDQTRHTQRDVVGE